jgi:DNA-binding NarL/FixJ family response regulator
MVITVFADERNVLASIEAGAVGYVLKDSGDADLVATLDAALRKPTDGLTLTPHSVTGQEAMSGLIYM